jgi:SAM-dependent methyltransferase
VDLDAFLRLLTPAGRRALDEAVELVETGADQVRAASTMRRSHDAALTAAALTQAALRRRAEAKFGADARRMFFTPDGLEQATRPPVADRRAARVAALGAPVAVADVCCGIGGDLIALARAGCAVDAVDRDPLTAAVARANADALGLTGVRVRTGAAEDVDPGAYQVLFADPARRRAGGRVFDPAAYSPPWPVVLDLAGRAPAGCVKAAPGLPHELVPDRAEVEWVSFAGEVKEAALWLGRLAPALAPGARIRRRATSLPSGETLAADGEPTRAAAGPIGDYLYEPDGAAIRAGLVAEVAELVGGRLLDPMIAYITGDRRVETPWASCYAVREMMPFSVKRLRAALRARGVGEVTIKKRGSAVDVERLRRDLRPSGDESAVVVLTRIGDKPYAVICAAMRNPAVHE